MRLEAWRAEWDKADIELVPAPGSLIEGVLARRCAHVCLRRCLKEASRGLGAPTSSGRGCPCVQPWICHGDPDMSKSIIDRLLDTQYTQETLRDEDCWAETQCDSTQPDSELCPAKLWDVEPTPGHDVCTTDEDVETTASEGDDKEDHRLEIPSCGIREVTEADIAAGCNAAALPSSEDLELCLRKLGGLGHSPLHPPPPRSFARQAEAIRYLEGLLAQGVYRCISSAFSPASFLPRAVDASLSIRKWALR